MAFQSLQNTDQELWKGIQERNSNALGELFNRYYSLMVAYGLKLAVSGDIVFDCIQEIFFRIWNSHHNLADVCHVNAYLLKALRNEIFFRQHQKSRFVTLDDEKNSEPIEISFSYQDLIMQKETSCEIHEFLIQALNKLGPRQKEAIYLKFYFAMSNDEIGEIMGLQNQTVRNTLYEALKLLRQITTVSAS